MFLGSAERKIIIQAINSLGQSTWNKDAKLNKGMYIPTRRPNSKHPREAKNHETCANCLRPIYGKYLRQHWNRCTNGSMKGERIVKSLGRAIEKCLHTDACDELSEQIFPNMNHDDCVDVVRYDWLLITFGNDLCLNYSANYQRDLIKRHLRSAGKLLLAARSISERITDFTSLLHVKSCNIIINAIRTVSGFDQTTKSFKHPSTAAATVTLINNIAKVFLIESMKEEKKEQEENVTRFATVFEKEAKVKINKIVGVMKEKAHRERDENIPSTADVRRLADYIDAETDKCFTELKLKYSYPKWLYLGQLTMASIIVFNRRRVGEVRNILVRDFKRRVVIADKYAEQLDGGSPDEALDKTIRLIRSRMKIRGKLDRSVPVLLTHTTDACLQLLYAYRRRAKVPITNNFLFALPSVPKRLRIIDGWAVMRRFSTKCGADNPSSLRGTNLRKQLASSCSTMGLTDNEVTNVAKHMGHDDQIHRNIYRHNPLQMEVVQMTELLQAAQGKDNFARRTNADPTKSNSSGTTKRTGSDPAKRFGSSKTKATNSVPNRTNKGSAKRKNIVSAKRKNIVSAKRKNNVSAKPNANLAKRTSRGVAKRSGKVSRTSTGPSKCTTSVKNSKNRVTVRTIRRVVKR